MSQKFRYDINGLRAYAVALVVLFHFGITGFAGGFIGVDIFFVISGFLMTKIIVSGLEKKTFSFINFYIARANRIIPALTALSIAVGVIGWFTLLPYEFKEYVKHAITSLSFLSNIQYFRESGYFDTASHDKILLHTWSLSVEWQFYIILPIIIFAINKLSKNVKIIKISYIILFFISLISCIYYSKINPTASFYLLPFRAWEMMAGGLVYLFFSKIKLSNMGKNSLEILGFILITISLILFSGKTIWPSYNALLPVIGTMLILTANNNNSIFTKNIFCQFLGNTSYSIYLWHWPIVFYLSYIEKSNEFIYILLGLISSIFFGWLSYKFIENPSRLRLSKLNTLKVLSATLVYLAIPSLAFATVFIKKGIPERFDNELRSISAAEVDKNPMREKCHITSGIENIPNCTYGEGEIGVIVLGDSHAESIVRSVEKSLPNKKSVLHWTYSSCPMIKGVKQHQDQDFMCSEFIEYALKNKEKFKNIPIIISNRLDFLDFDKHNFYVEDDNKKNNSNELLSKVYGETLCEFSKHNPVFVLNPVPIYTKNVPSLMGHRFIMNNNNRVTVTTADYLKSSKTARQVQEDISKKCNVKVINTSKYFCNNNYCYADKNKMPLYYDSHHLNIFGADQLIPEFKNIFN